MTREQIRKIQNYAALSLSGLAALFGLFWLVLILGDVLVNGIGALRLDLFFNEAVPAGMTGGGLRHAFAGQLMITLAATLIGVPVGVLGGTFLAEYARGTSFARIISILADIMVSVPSIVIGAFVYAILVQPLHHFSGWAGAVALGRGLGGFNSQSRTKSRADGVRMASAGRGRVSWLLQLSPTHHQALHSLPENPRLQKQVPSPSAHQSIPQQLR